MRSERGEITTNTIEIQKQQNTTNSFMPVNWTTRRNGQISRNIKPWKTELGRNR